MCAMCALKCAMRVGIVEKELSERGFGALKEVQDPQNTTSRSNDRVLQGGREPTCPV